jgi:small subunit ribosomal protein S1
MTSNQPGSGEAEEMDQDQAETRPSDAPGTTDIGATEEQVNRENLTGEQTPGELVDDPEAATSAERAEVAEPPVADAPAEEAATEQPVADEPADAVAEQPAADDAAADEATEQPHAEETPQAEPATAEVVPTERTSEPPPVNRGDLIEATIIETTPTQITVDLDGKATGVVPNRELERMGRDTIEGLNAGEKVWVFVVNPRDHNSNVLVSINRALEELDWRRAEEFRANQTIYESRIAGYNKGGLIVRFGRLRGFVPQSQIGSDRRQAMEGETPEERWSDMVNQEIAVKVMEVDRGRNRLILSERVAAREVREIRKESLIADLEVGDVKVGRVVSLVDFGAFVDVGGAEGLVHLTELSWQHVTHPREVVKVGQEVKVEVISVDPDRKRIGLSMKRQAEDPWDTVAASYTVGQLVQGTITKLTKFGAFAQLADAPEIEGLVHISELSDQRVNHPREVVNEGDTLTLRVVKIDIQNRRLGLSLKRVNSAEYLDLDWN